MDADHIRIYIREVDKDIFYQLEDIRYKRNTPEKKISFLDALVMSKIVQF